MTGWTDNPLLILMVLVGLALFLRRLSNAEKGK